MKNAIATNLRTIGFSVACAVSVSAQDAPAVPEKEAPAVADEINSPRESSRAGKPIPGRESVAPDAPQGTESTKDLEKMVEREKIRKEQSDTAAVEVQAMSRPNAQMQAVLDELAAMNPKPLETLTAEQARRQPSPADAAKVVAKRENKSAEPIGKVENVDIKLSNVDLKGRVYRPEGDGPFSVIFYIHGGGWVIADLDTYDATPRALCKAANAVVVSTHYRQAPEHKFPTAHNDVYGAYQWTLENAGRWGGNTKKVAVVGESAGGNMAASLCIMAQAEGKPMPLHQVLIYPVANTELDTESYMEDKNAKPLNAAMMKWFMDQTLANPGDATDPKLALLQAKTLEGLPPATIITAQIDPLRSDGEALAKKLQSDGVPVMHKNYEGVTHEFFGMGLILDEAKQATELVASRLAEAFSERGTSAADRRPNEPLVHEADSNRGSD